MSLALVIGIALGLSLAAPPGPMNAIIAAETVERGWAAGVLAGLGAMASDICFFLLAAIGAVTIVAAVPSIRAGMLVVGGLLMLWFALDAMRPTETEQRVASIGRTRGFRRAFVLGLTNPYQILWWVAVGIAFLDPNPVMVGGSLPGIRPIAVTGGPDLVGGLFLGIGVWIVSFPTILRHSEDRIRGLGRTVGILSGVVLMGFGVVFLWSGLETLASLVVSSA